jgi:predicted MPP superfamily phosphohydrolase
MKVITIGDLHGSPAWEKIDPEAWDRVVFIGDYVDSGDYSSAEIIRNLKQVIGLKVRYPDKVVLLFGNHDLAYFYGGHERHYCSGFRKSMLAELFSLFTANRKLFDAAFQLGSHLWTHAGVVQRWYDNYILDQVLKEDVNLAATLNRLFQSYYEPLYHASLIRGGLYEDGGIFWAHSNETREDPLRGYHQVVGHTRTNNGITNILHSAAGTSVTYVDCLQTDVQFHHIEI